MTLAHPRGNVPIDARVARERDEALACAERRQGTIDKITAERDEALKGDPCEWCCAELLRAQAQRDDERASVASMTAEVTSLGERITELLGQRSEAHAEAERLKADLEHCEICEREPSAMHAPISVCRHCYDVALDPHCAHESLDTPYGRRMRLDVLHSIHDLVGRSIREEVGYSAHLLPWLDAQIAEAKTQAGEENAQIGNLVRGAADFVQAVAAALPYSAEDDDLLSRHMAEQTRGLKVRPLRSPASTEPKPVAEEPRRVGTQTGGNTWSWMCCVIQRYAGMSTDRTHCETCGAAWHRPEAGG